MNISQWPKADLRWYLGVRCKKCRTPILFALDHSEDAGQPPSAGRLVLTCTLANCRHQGDYTGAAVWRYQKQPVKADEALQNENGKSRKNKA